MSPNQGERVDLIGHSTESFGQCTTRAVHMLAARYLSKNCPYSLNFGLCAEMQHT
jgi:hypothetical protein